MDSVRWQELKSILDGALQLPPELRDAFIAQSSDDPVLRDEVTSLLASYSSDPEFLEEAVADEALSVVAQHDAAGMIGSRVGRYRIIREIGRGGMGTVYLAERADGEYEQQVAIKLVSESRMADTIRVRLRQERQILARLQHPNIARLVDGGVTDDGLPFLVMEYVDGKSIHEYCNDNRLTTDQRLKLFATICDAVHFAHQNLVVHRDIKPSNILVDQQGRPKLLDFGIAKLLDDDDDAFLTRTGGHALTPAYASPEQVQGDRVSTASDTYSLGVVLFELLTGRRPYEMNGKSASDIERAICLTEPPKPSSIVTRSEEAGTLQSWREEYSPRLRKQLQGDIDMIVLKALRKDAARRYVSAADLAADCRRHLSHMPVMARPETLSYVASTFVRRHRWGVAASILVALSLLGAVIGTSWQARIAANERDKARDSFEAVYALSNTMLLDLHDTIRDLPGTTLARRTLVAQATRYLDILAVQASDTDSLSDDLAVAYERLGEIQGDPHFPNLGDMAAAKSRYEAAMNIRHRHWLADSTDDDATSELANIVGRLAVVNSWSGDNELAIQQSKRALQLLDSVANSVPKVRHDKFRIRSELGWWYVWAGRMDDGLVELGAAERIAEELVTTGYEGIEFDIDRWRIIAYKVDGLDFKGDRSGALDLLKTKGLPLAERTVERHPGNPRAEGILFTIRSKTARLLESMDRTTEALAEYRVLRSISEDLVRRDTANARLINSFAATEHSIGSMLVTLEQPQQALPHFENALSIRKRLLAGDPTNGEFGYIVASTLQSLCTFHGDASNLTKALSYCEEAASVQDHVAEDDPHNLVGQGARKDIYLETARVHIRMGELASGPRKDEHFARGLAWYDRALRLVSELDASGVAFDWVKNPEPIENERQTLIDRMAS